MNILSTSSKCQVVIPKNIRKKLNIKPKQKVLIKAVKDHVEITPLPDDPIESLCGIFKDGPSLVESLLKVRREDLKHEEGA